MEHFSGSPFEHLGREVPQNTIDALATAPAKVRISLINIPTASIPGIDDLKATVKRCLKGAPEESPKAETFFKNALALLEKDTVKVLQIADYNTTGVIGPCENGKPFFAMMKATGQSKKSGTSTGSYGIGKFAPFTVSELRTVFLTTVWADSTDTQHHYAQGKSILMSHMVGKKTHRGTGFWGLREGCLPVETTDVLPAWMKREGPDGSLEDQPGTTLSILGFAGRKNWERALGANIAENFFGAIQEGTLQVEIEGGPTINQDTLHDIFNDTEIRASIEDQKGEPEKFGNVRSYLRALTDAIEVKVEETQNHHLGKCRLRILIGEGLPRKVAVLRNGMLITDELTGLKRFGSYKEFVAVLECRNEKGQALLRAMEPPRHDDFEPDRLSPDQRQSGRVALREIAKWVREMLDRHAKDEVSEVTTLDELADFFGDEEEAGDGKQKDENPGGAIIVRQRQMKVKARVATYATPTGAIAPQADPEESSGDGFKDVPDSKTTGGKVNEGTAKKGEGEPKQGEGSKGTNTETDLGGTSPKKTTATGIALRDVRAVPLGPSLRRVAFTPSVSGKVSVELQDSGADANYMLDVKGTSLGGVRSGRIEGVAVKAGQRVIIEVELEKAFVGTLRVVANAI